MTTRPNNHTSRYPDRNQQPRRFSAQQELQTSVRVEVVGGARAVWSEVRAACPIRRRRMLNAGALS
jgi:hypothetical protein